MEDSVVFTNVAANAIEDVSITLDLKGDFSTRDAFIEVFAEEVSLGKYPDRNSRLQQLWSS